MYLCLVLVIVLSFFIIPQFLLNLVTLFVGKNKSKKVTSEISYDYAFIITAYKDIKIVKPLVLSLLKQSYSNFHVYMVADQCGGEMIDVIDEKFTQFSPASSLNSKSKSIKYAIDRFLRNHDFVVILDPDNLVKPNYLEEINFWTNKKYKAVQGKRIAKNLDSNYAKLDALNDYYYNHTHRMVPHLLGLSATISGSGMAIETSIYKRFFDIENIDAHIIAEDKMLQNYIVGQLCEKIAFSNDAIVFDEKVSTGNQVQRQRTRWIASYFQFFKIGFQLMVKGLSKFNFNSFVFGYLNVIPPLFLLGMVSILNLIISIFVSVNLVWAQSVLLGVLFVNFFLSIFLAGVKPEVLKALLFVPLFVLRQFLGFLNINATKKDFLVTEKKHLKNIEDLES